MAGEPGCVVGVDGLPLGTGAVVAVDRVVVAELELASDAGRPLDLVQRLHQAIRLGGERVGRAVGEVRLVLLDDGSSGTDLLAITAELAMVGVALRVVDVEVDDLGETASVRRARLAALDDGGP